MPRKNADGQVELVLENRQLLLIFFAIVAICGIFFSLGYIVGRNTLSVSAKGNRETAGTEEAGDKPSPMPPAAFVPEAPNATQASAPPHQQTPTSPDLNLDQSAEKAPDTKLQPAQPSAPATPVAEKQPAPALDTSGGILIQVSALTRREDADVLVSLLKDKKMPVSVATGPNDTLFRVVVGPYKTDKEAQAAKAALEGDGFRPIIKR